MRLSWLRAAGTPELVLVFAGFAMDERPFAPLSGGSDLAVVHSYHDLDWPAGLPAALDAYRRIDILAWSLGVWAIGQVGQLPERPGRRIALAGTPRPLDREFGIPPAVFDRTRRHFDAAGQAAFYGNLSPDPAERRIFAAHAPARDWRDQAAELASLQTMIQSRPLRDPVFDLAIIPQADRIFPPASQERHWTGKTPIRRIAAGHYALPAWQTWDELLALEAET